MAKKYTELELAEMIKKHVTEAIQPYLKVVRPEGEVDEKGKGIFKDLGEYLQCICLQEKSADARAKLELYQKTLSMDSDPAGGYRVPEGFIDEVLMAASQDGIVRPLATVIPAGTEHPDQEVNIPTLNQAGATTKGMFAGVWFQWTNEGAAKPDKEPEFDNVKLAPEEYSASTVITDKLIRNATGMEAFVKKIYSRAQIAYEDYYFLRGNGVTQPLGVIGSPPYIQANRLVAGAIDFGDITAIIAQMLPGADPIWVISKSCYAEIVTLDDGHGHSIFIQGDATKKVSDKLMGFPIKWSFRTPALGAVGDISLCDFSYYLIKDGFGPAFDTSKHVYFASNKTMLKMFGNTDGQPWMNGTITAEDEATEISPFVGLSVEHTG